MADYVDNLSDAELRTKLAEYGFPLVPITTTTRKVMVKKLKMLIANKNKIVASTSDGRRSLATNLAKYSSEEDNDNEEEDGDDVQIVEENKRSKATTVKKNRRATMVGGGGNMVPPSVPVSKMNRMKTDETRGSSRTKTSNDNSTSTSTTTRIIRMEVEDDLTTGSDSEPEYVNTTTNSPSLNLSKKRGSSVGSSSFSSPATGAAAASSSTSYYLSSRSPASTTTNATDQLSQMRARLNLSTSTGIGRTSFYDRKTTSATAAADNDDDYNDDFKRTSEAAAAATPFLSNFSKRMSRLTSNTASPYSLRTDYRNDVTIKEHDANGNSGGGAISSPASNSGTSAFSRSYFSRVLGSGAGSALASNYSRDFKRNQEKNFLRNNFVSFALLALAIAFFVAISLLYMGMRSEQTATNIADHVIPLCKESGGPHTKPGINCVRESDSLDALNLLKVLRSELTKRSVQHYCSSEATYSKPYMTDENIIDFVSSNYALKDPYEIQKAINNLQVLILKNPKWGVAIINTDSYLSSETSTALDTMVCYRRLIQATSCTLVYTWLLSSGVSEMMSDAILNNRHTRKLAMIIRNPSLPWKCLMLNKLYSIVTSLLLLATGFSLMFLGHKIYKYIVAKRKFRNDQIYSLVERIIDILQTNAAPEADQSVTTSTDCFLAVNHVRDMLIPPHDRKRLSSIWHGAVTFLHENESRVRTEILIVSGEECHVWRWLGSSPVTNRSPKSWQGQAFETQTGAVNSLPCSPTPCLKVRGMLDEGVGAQNSLVKYTVRDAVLSKCAQQCKILHCELDLTSGCVYLKCANQAEAAVAYRNLHGWWYDGHLVTVKYLRLERYMQRFPNSPTEGPPYLSAATSTSAFNNNNNNNSDNDWLNRQND